MVVQCCIRYEFFIEMYTDATSHPGFFCKFTLVYAVFRLDINTHLTFLSCYLKCVCIKIHLNISYLIRFLVSHLSFKSISLFSFFGWILVSGSFYQPKIIYNDENDLLKKTWKKILLAWMLFWYKWNMEYSYFSVLYTYFSVVLTSVSLLECTLVHILYFLWFPEKRKVTKSWKVIEFYL